MPQDFSRDLQASVTPMRATEVPSSLGAAANIAQGVARVFSNIPKAKEPTQPAWAERKAAWEREGIRTYSSDLNRLQQEFESGDITEFEYASRQRLVNVNFEQAGYDLSAGQFKNIRESVTGLEDSQFGVTAAEDTINRYQKEGNYGAIAYAQSEVVSRGMPQNENSVAQILNEKSFLQAQIDNININDEAGFVRNRDILINGIREASRQQQFVLSQLDEKGIIIPAEVSVGSAQEALLTYQRFNDRIPANVSTEQRRIFDEEAERYLTPWKALGLIDENNALVSDALTSNEVGLRLKNKLNAYARVLSGEDDGIADMLATFGITNATRSGSLWNDERLVTVIPDIEARIANDGLTDKVSEILPNIEELQNRTIFGLNQMLIERQKATAIGEGFTQTLIANLPEDQAAVWKNYTPEQSIAQFENMVDTLGGVNLSGIADAPSTEGLLNTVVGLSIAMDTIDFSLNAYSSEGLQSRFNNLIPVIGAYKEANPREGAVAEQLMFTAISESKAQYDLQIRNRENKVFDGGGFIWDSASNSYKVSGTANPSSSSFEAIKAVTEFYDGNLSQAVQDNFNRVPETYLGTSDKPIEERVAQASGDFPTITQSLSRRDTEQLKVAVNRKLMASFRRDFGGDTLTDIEDLRRSAAYLGRLGSKLEPNEYKALIEERNSASVADLPSYATSMNFGGREIYVNSNLNPSLEIVSGQTHAMVQPWAVNNLKAITDGPFREVERLFGSPLTINDALPKVGTSRADPNYEEGKGSQHFYGNAIDIDISNMSDSDRMRLMESALQSGARGLGLGKNILHIDFRDTYTAWDYPTTGDTWGGVSVSDLDGMIENYGVRVPSFQRTFNSRGAATQVTTDEDPETEGSQPNAPFNLGGGEISAPAQTQPIQTGEAVEVQPVQPQNQLEQQPQSAPQQEAPVTQEQEVEAVIEATTGQGKTYNSLEELDQAYQTGEVNAGEEVTVMTSEGESVFRINEDGSVVRVR